jgi:hypothetical protein
MRFIAAVSVLFATLSACEPAPAPQSAAAPSPTTETQATPVAQTRFHAANPLHEAGDTVRGKAVLAQERAIGIVAPTYGDRAPSELTVVNDTASEVQTIARVRFYPQPDGGWTDTIWTREAGAYGGLMRATHDDYGLPVVARNGEWLRVHYAFARDGSPLSGWVRLAEGHTVYHDRDEQMYEFSTDLADPQSTDFFAQPGGQRVQVDLRPSHMLEVLRINGDWIQVALLRPDTSPCTGDPQLKVQRGDTVWVRRYNAQGKRQLLSAVAGC